MIPAFIKRKLSERLFTLLEPKIEKAVHSHLKKELLRNKRFQEHLQVCLEAVRVEWEFAKDQAVECQDRFEVLRVAIKHAEENNSDGLWLEFGVNAGTSVNFIAKNIAKTVYGFDSFEGLPEDWQRSRLNTQPKGSMSQNQKLPPHEANVHLIKGWFQETLPVFVKDYSGPVSFTHIDSDLYSSAKCILDHLALRNGSVIVFDEYYHYPYWRDGEYKAFHEFLAEKHFEARCLAYCSSDKQAAFVLKPAKTS